MLKNGKTKILIGACTAAVLIYIIVMYIGSSSSMVHTEPASYATVSNTIRTTGYIIRNETYVTNNTNGVVVYELPSGGTVSVNGVIASVYKSEADAIEHKKITDLTNEIERLKKLNATTQMQGTSLETINNSLNSKVSNLIDNFRNSEIYKLNESRQDILYVINQRQLLIGSVKDFNKKITDLENEKKALEATINAPVAVIKSPIAGYFVEYTDGLENSYAYSKAEDITYNKLKALEKKEPQKVAENVIGKIISSLNWYIFCPVTTGEALEFNSADDEIKMIMPFASTDSLKVDVAAVNPDSNEKKDVIVLTCKDMSEQLAGMRSEDVQIAVNTYDGIKVAKRSLHDDVIMKTVEKDDGTTTTEKKKVQGVYVLYDNELLFKQVVVTYSDEEFVIINPTPAGDKLFNGETIKLYDEIVVEGADLYAGKKVRQA
ncbi:hypothetical protein AGMMS50284_1540 [Clostridia bacterium]|nr:hypothetical protein AGMMS50284_1540 [Clostridia bacterium]